MRGVRGIDDGEVLVHGLERTLVDGRMGGEGAPLVLRSLPLCPFGWLLQLWLVNVGWGRGREGLGLSRTGGTAGVEVGISGVVLIRNDLEGKPIKHHHGGSVFNTYMLHTNVHK